jgi:hypothetical protein
LPEKAHVIFVFAILIFPKAKQRYRGPLACSFTAALRDMFKTTRSTFLQMKRCCQGKIHVRKSSTDQQFLQAQWLILVPGFRCHHTLFDEEGYSERVAKTADLLLPRAIEEWPI